MTTEEGKPEALQYMENLIERCNLKEAQSELVRAACAAAATSMWVGAILMRSLRANLVQWLYCCYRAWRDSKHD